MDLPIILAFLSRSNSFSHFVICLFQRRAKLCGILIVADYVWICTVHEVNWKMCLSTGRCACRPNKRGCIQWLLEIVYRLDRPIESCLPNRMGDPWLWWPACRAMFVLPAHRIGGDMVLFKFYEYQGFCTLLPVTDSNWRPWSECNCSGTENLQKSWSTKIFATVITTWLGMG